MRWLVLLPIRLYRWGISPLLPQRCKYHPSCSAYAIEAVQSHGALRGLVLAGWRLLRCNPFTHGGVDFASDQRVFGCERRAHASSGIDKVGAA